MQYTWRQIVGAKYTHYLEKLRLANSNLPVICLIISTLKLQILYMQAKILNMYSIKKHITRTEAWVLKWWMGILKKITVLWDSGMTLYIPIEFCWC
jgi:hypothetical protein